MSSPEVQGESAEVSGDGPATPDTVPDELLEESIASQARLAPRRVSREASSGDPRSGGDASRAPTSLSATELHPIEGASSGVSWDDPDEL